MKHKRDVMTTQQAAVLLNLSTTSVQKMVTSGELDAWITPGGHRRIFRSSIDQFLNSRSTGLAGITGRLPLRILLIEDDPSQITIFKSLLERIGHSIQLTIVNKASQALDHTIALHPDLLVIDLVTEPVDGLDLVRAIGNDANLKGLDVIALTASNQEHLIDSSFANCRVVRCEKPINAERLCGYLDALSAKLLARAELRN